MRTFQEYLNEGLLNEGVHDRYIFKAIFLAGGPGSGKSYVRQNALEGFGLKVINSDDIFEKMLRDAGMQTTTDDIFSPKGQEIRAIAKETTRARQENYLIGRLGLIIDGTGKDFNKIKRQADELKELGYDVSMVFVNTSLDVALERNLLRERTLASDMVKKAWNDVQDNIGKFQRYFGSNNFIIVDNNNASQKELDLVWKDMWKQLEKPIKNPIAKKWIQEEMKNR